MRTLNADALALLARIEAGERIPVVQLVQLVLTETIYLTTAGRAISWGGHSWLPAGLGAIEPIEDVGGIYDDTATVLDNLESSHHLGGRAVSAFDFVDGDGDYLQLAYDGGDDALDAVYAGLWNAIQRARPAGITVGFVLRERGS